MKVLSVFGTRPEAIKMAPLLKAMQVSPKLESIVAVSAQHREMLDQVLQLFDIRPEYDLNLMRPGQSLSDITSAVLTGLHPILEQEKPDLLLVHGDTTTTFAAALAAYYHQIPVGHVEAGLRSGDKYAPYPEECNRRLTGVMADLHFSPTETAADNLRRENIPEDKIFVTGNTVIDALLSSLDKPCPLEGLGLENVDWSKKVILMTCHRRENWGQPMEQIFTATADILGQNPDCELIIPLHKNPLVREIAYRCLGGSAQVHYCEPLDYLPFCHVMKKSHLVLTDSGGLQEEAPALGKPVLVLRDVTERPEAVAAGTALLAGTSYDSVFHHLEQLLQDGALYTQMAQARNPYGDGHAAERITRIIEEWGETAAQPCGE